MAKTARIGRAAREDQAELDPGLDPFSRESIELLVRRYGSPLLVVDTARVRAQYRQLAAALPGVDLHYALKPLPSSAVVRILSEEGASFDVATTGEVDLVLRAGVAPERCIHTHPIKRECDIRNAIAYGIKVFVVDNPDEIRKFVKFRKERLAADPRGVPQPRRRVRFVAQIRLRPEGGAATSGACRRVAPAGRRTVVPRGIADPGPRDARAGHRGVPRVDVRTPPRAAMISPRSTSGAVFPSPTARRCPPSRNIALPFAGRSDRSRRPCASSPSRDASSSRPPPSPYPG